MTERHHVAQRERVHFPDVAAARKREDHVAGKELAQNLARPKKLDVDALFCLASHLGSRKLRITLPCISPDFDEDLRLHGAIDREALHHPAEGMLPGEMPDFVEEVVPAPGNEQHIERN